MAIFTRSKRVNEKGLPISSQLKTRAAKIYELLLKHDPDPRCALDHKNPFELLMATILSAQCTDVRVNIVTPALFEKYPSAEAMAKARRPTLEKLVQSTGFYRNKAKSLNEASKRIVAEFNGQVPDTMEDLLSLQGVARKTANVVLGNAFNKNIGVVVDTHVGRLSRRMGFTKEKDPKKVEQDLMKIFPQKNWTQLSHLLIWHGRRACSARKPDCENCIVKNQCPKKL